MRGGRPGVSRYSRRGIRGGGRPPSSVAGCGKCLSFLACALMAVVPLGFLLASTARAAEAADNSSKEPRTVWVQVLVDLSGSMDSVLPGGQGTRMAAMNAQLKDVRLGLLAPRQLPENCHLRVSVAGFWSRSQQVCAKQLNDCVSGKFEQETLVPPFEPGRKAPASEPWPDTNFKSRGSLTDTPLESAWREASRDLAERGKPGDARLLLLATDGVPSCRRWESPSSATSPCGVKGREFAQAMLHERLRQAWREGSKPGAGSPAWSAVCPLALDLGVEQAIPGSVFWGEKQEALGPAPGCEAYTHASAVISPGDFSQVVNKAIKQACGKKVVVTQPCAGPAQFAEVVAVGDAGHYHCSGVLLSSRAVLTARHCLPASEVLVGESITRSAEYRAVVETLLPPDARADVALLRLSRPVDIPLRKWSDRPPPQLGAGAIHVGFGASSPTGESGFGDKKLRLINLTGSGCGSERSLTTGCNPELELVSAGSPGHDTCSGDSGGGLFEPVPTGEQCVDKAGRARFVHDWRLLGITSRSIAGGSAVCGPGGIYTRLDVLTPWLEDVLAASAL